jgi:hypothetical protein
MAIQQIDFEFRLPDLAAATHFYYWTNTFFGDTANPPPTNSTQYWLSVMHELATLTVTQICASKVTSPPGSGIFIIGGRQIPHGGLYTFTGGWSPFDIVRLSFWAGEKYVGYKLWRMPVPANQQSGGYLSAAVLNHFRTTVIPAILFAKICTRDGVPIDAITVSPRVHMWSYRHGTKRRDRRVLSFP